jgi:hypothetical protein
MVWSEIGVRGRHRARLMAEHSHRLWPARTENAKSWREKKDLNFLDFRSGGSVESILIVLFTQYYCVSIKTGWSVTISKSGQKLVTKFWLQSYELCRGHFAESRLAHPHQLGILCLALESSSPCQASRLQYSEPPQYIFGAQLHARDATLDK